MKLQDMSCSAHKFTGFSGCLLIYPLCDSKLNDFYEYDITEALKDK